MSNSLSDQLLKSGVVSEQEVKKARNETSSKKKKARKPKKKERGAEESEAAKFAKQVDEAKRARDRDLNKQREAERQREADEKAAREMLVNNEIARGNDATLTYNFTFDNRIKKLNVTQEQRDGLANGRLAIGRTRGQFRLVDRKTAERIQSMAPFLIVWLDDGADSSEDNNGDDPYADFPVPDDMMW
jgi:uncharacterized protein YaiL (DUF2058 family)